MGRGFFGLAWDQAPKLHPCPMQTIFLFSEGKSHKLAEQGRIWDLRGVICAKMLVSINDNAFANRASA